MVRFIHDHRDQYGVEPICTVLPIAPSTYHRHRAAAGRSDASLGPGPQRDDALRLEIQRVYDEQHQVYGPRKVWKQLRREGFCVARCTVGRLMRARGLEGAGRGRAWITTTHAGNGSRPADLVDRQFVATRPNQLWVSDFTYVATGGGFTYAVAFVIDVFARRIVGWRVSASDAHGLRARRLGAGHLRAPRRRADRPRASQRSRHAVSFDAVHGSSRGRRHCAIGREPRRRVRITPSPSR